MDFAEYQKEVEKTAEYPSCGTSDRRAVFYTLIGLQGEIGEAAKKIMNFVAVFNPDLSYIDQQDFLQEIEESNDKEKILKELKESIVHELGDVLWYLASLSREMGSSLEEIAEANILKIRSRKDRGKIQGSGDDR